MISVLLGDQHETIAQNIASGLADINDIDFWGYTTDAVDFLNKATKRKPDVMIIDFMEPVKKGCEMVKQLLTACSCIPILVISSIEDDWFVARLGELGAAYYLIKPFYLIDLVNRIKYVSEYHGNTLNQLYLPDRQMVTQFLTSYFTKIGIPASFKGHRYLLDAILLVSQDCSWMNSITKRLYPAVARCNKTTASHVERSIRYAIDTAWTRGDINELEQLFPYAIDPAKGKPTNSAFIAKMADIIKFCFEN